MAKRLTLEPVVGARPTARCRVTSIAGIVEMLPVENTGSDCGRMLYSAGAGGMS